MGSPLRRSWPNNAVTRSWARCFAPPSSKVGGRRHAEVLARGVARGELPADADLELLADVGSALLWHRLTITGAPLGDDLPERIVAQFFPLDHPR